MGYVKLAPAPKAGTYYQVQWNNGAREKRFVASPRGMSGAMRFQQRLPYGAGSTLRLVARPKEAK